MSEIESTQVPSAEPTSGKIRIPLIVAVLAILVAALGQFLFHRANASNNHVALASLAKGVTVTEARSTTYRATRRYIGRVEPWIEAHVGPQLVSAYVSTVLVRPGTLVARGDVLATLDCRETDANSRAIASEAHAVEANQLALARQAERVTGLLGGGFVAANDVDQHQAESDRERARLLAARAQLAGASLAVNDCILRAPFDGEISERLIDPGAFIRPGTSVVSEIDRNVVRIATDVPETDYELVAPNAAVQINLVATHRAVDGTIARRSPAADDSTRTIHIEIDVADPTRMFPVNTTAEILIHVGTAVDAIEIPLTAADVRGRRASLFVAEEGYARARTANILGESGGNLFIEPTLPHGSQVVTEGRTTLTDGDRIHTRVVNVGGVSQP